MICELIIKLNPILIKYWSMQICELSQINLDVHDTKEQLHNLRQCQIWKMLIVPSLINQFLFLQLRIVNANVVRNDSITNFVVVIFTEEQLFNFVFSLHMISKIGWSLWIFFGQLIEMY